MEKILCIWSSKNDRPVFTEEKNLVYRNGDFSIFRQSPSSYLYTYKGVSIKCLVGMNKELVDCLASGKVYENNFLYKSSIENIEKAKHLLKIHGTNW